MDKNIALYDLIWRSAFLQKKGFYRVKNDSNKRGIFMKRELYQLEAFNSLGSIALRVFIVFLDRTEQYVEGVFDQV